MTFLVEGKIVIESEKEKERECVRERELENVKVREKWNREQGGTGREKKWVIVKGKSENKRH